jgi:uncharacterized protein (DUF58 family)
MMSSDAPLDRAPPYDPAVLERVRALWLRARQTVAGLHQGAHRSIRLGSDVEFADYKPYSPGDALRDVDWRVYGRTDRLVVRRYRAETELAATVVLDASADLGSVPAKFERAVRLAATLAYFLHLGGEPVGLRIGAGEGDMQRDLPPRTGRRHLAAVFASLAAVRPGGRADLGAIFREVGGRLGARTLVAVVSDFMEEPASWADDLGALVRNRVDLRALHVYDPGELTLAYDAPLLLRSPESLEDVPVDPDAAREPFEQIVRAWFDEVSAAVRSRRGQHLPVPTDADDVAVLRRFAEGRA